MASEPGAPCTLIFIDFGMVGRLGPRAMVALRESTVAVATNDPERFVMALDNLGVILPGADRRPIIQAAQVLFRHTYDRSIRARPRATWRAPARCRLAPPIAGTSEIRSDRRLCGSSRVRSKDGRRLSKFGYFRSPAET